MMYDVCYANKVCYYYLKAAPQKCTLAPKNFFRDKPGNRLFGIHKAWKCVFRGFRTLCLFLHRENDASPRWKRFQFFSIFGIFILLNRLILGHFYKFRYFFNMRLISLMVHKKIMYFYMTMDG